MDEFIDGCLDKVKMDEFIDRKLAIWNTRMDGYANNINRCVETN